MRTITFIMAFSSLMLCVVLFYSGLELKEAGRQNEKRLIKYDLEVQLAYKKMLEGQDMQNDNIILRRFPTSIDLIQSTADEQENIRENMRSVDWLLIHVGFNGVSDFCQSTLTVRGVDIELSKNDTDIAGDIYYSSKGPLHNYLQLQ